MFSRFFALITLTAAIVFAPAAQANEDCTVGIEAIRSYIDVHSPKIEKVISARQGERSFEQIFKLKSGATVTFGVGGCTHHGISFVFRDISNLSVALRPEELIRVARDQLDAIPINKDDEISLSAVKDTLRSATLADEMMRLDSGLLFSCGEFKTCRIDVSEPGILKITYSYAL